MIFFKSNKRKRYDTFRFYSLAILSGLLALFLSPFAFKFSLLEYTLGIPWSIIFPCIISILYTKKGAVIAGISGGAFFPFYLWPADGYANLYNSAFLMLIYLSIATFVDYKKSDKHSKWLNPVLVYPLAFATLITIHSFCIFYLFPFLLSINPPFWYPQAVTYMPQQMLLGIFLVNTYSYSLITILSGIFLKLPAIRHLLGLKIQAFSKDNHFVFLLALFVALFIWGVFFILDHILIHSGQEPKEYLKLSFMVIILGSAIVARILIFYLEKIHKSEKLLKENENKYRSLFENSGDGVIIISENKIIDSNAKALEMVQAEKEDIIGLYPWEFSPELQPDGVSSKNKALELFGHASQKGYIKFEWQHQSLTGKLMDMEITVSLIDKDRQLFQASWRDISDRKKAEKIQIEHEENLRLMVEGSPLMTILSKGTTEEVVFINKRFEELIGYTISEMPDVDHWWPLGYPDIEYRAQIKQKWKENVERAVKNKRAFQNIESKVRCKNGKDIIVNWSFVTFGSVNIVFGADITQQKEHEQKLLAAKKLTEDNEIRLRTLINTIPDLVWLKDLNGVYITCNKKFERLYGAKEQEIIGKTDYDFLDKITAEFFRKNDMIAIKAGYPVMNEEEVTYLSDGHKEYIETVKTPFYGSSGELIGVLGIGRDISDRKKAEQALIETELMTSAMINTTEDLIWSVDPDKHGLLTFNIGLYNYFAKLNVFVKEGMAPDDIFNDKKNAEAWNNIYNTVIKQQHLKFEYADSKYNRFIDIHLHVIKQNNKVIGIAGFGRDITERKKVEKELYDYRNKLEQLVQEKTKDLEAMLKRWKSTSEELVQKKGVIEKQNEELKSTLEHLKKTQTQLIHAEKMASIGLLSAGIAHEINNPVNYIKGGITALKKTYQKMQNYLELINSTKANISVNSAEVELLPTDEEVNSWLKISNNMFENIEKGVEKTVQIIKSMHVFSSESEDEFKMVNVNTIIDDVLTILYNSYKYKITIEKEYANDPELVVIPGKIHQVIMNLLSNAIHAVKEQGTIRIQTSRNDKKNQFLISIKDNGTGIPANNLKKIFDPFFTTKEVGKGTGLGLYLAYSFIEQHGGTINVNSKVNQGTEFNIELPLKK